MNRAFSKISLSVLFALSTSVSSAAPSAKPPANPAPPSKVKRPPQYVMIGFDGGLNLPHWQEMRDFSKAMKRAKKPVAFTYFVSGVYFLSHNNKHIYAAPKHTPGYSLIGFAEDKPEIISDRVDMMNGAFVEGAEIASNANGHFDASEDKWNADDWSSELKQYDDLLFGAFFNNKAQPNPMNKYPHGYAFDSKEIVGFRAPNLGITPDLYPELKAYGYKYDISSTGEPMFWPRKDANGIWRFQVPSIELAGTAKKVLSMDYNFYEAQSKGVDDLANREVYRKQMLDSYMNYFNNNYYGNRTPVFIGHHFALYNGGAYWDAVKDFATQVCGKPEVKCVTYKQYAMWIDSLKDDKFMAYRNGQFDLLPRPRTLDYQPARSLDVRLQLRKIGEELKIIASGADYSSERMKIVISIDGKIMPLKKDLNLQTLRHQFPVGSELRISASVRNRRGLELQSDTHVIRDLGTAQEEFVEIPLEGNLKTDKFL
ncbi:MAG TPA: hypothetical protein VF412_15005 [Bdellovibrio sp.]|uniref:hypothetical protein n=1 Tax=Bdellovibrio sp. TaxID=28201 RepID=UPI002EDC19DF